MSELKQAQSPVELTVQRPEMPQGCPEGEEGLLPAACAEPGWKRRVTIDLHYTSGWSSTFFRQWGVWLGMLTSMRPDTPHAKHQSQSGCSFPVHLESKR